MSDMPERIAVHEWEGEGRDWIELLPGEDSPAEYVRADLVAEKDAEIERLNAENAELRREIGGFQHLSDMRQCTVDAADENERLRKALDQAIDRADLRVAKVADDGYCELRQRLPVWWQLHPELAAYLREREEKKR